MPRHNDAIHRRSPVGESGYFSPTGGESGYGGSAERPPGGESGYGGPLQDAPLRAGTGSFAAIFCPTKQPFREDGPTTVERERQYGLQVSVEAPRPESDPASPSPSRCPVWKW
ncbi:unnamed protein product [Arctogadus glacialis]